MLMLAQNKSINVTGYHKPAQVVSGASGKVLQYNGHFVAEHYISTNQLPNLSTKPSDRSVHMRPLAFCYLLPDIERFEALEACSLAIRYMEHAKWQLLKENLALQSCSECQFSLPLWPIDGET